MNKTTAQVATEAIVNMPEAYDLATMQAVYDTAVNAGVSAFYTDMLFHLLREREGVLR